MTILQRVVVVVVGLGLGLVPASSAIAGGAKGAKTANEKTAVVKPDAKKGAAQAPNELKLAFVNDEMLESEWWNGVAPLVIEFPVTVARQGLVNIAYVVRVLQEGREVANKTRSFQKAVSSDTVSFLFTLNPTWESCAGLDVEVSLTIDGKATVMKKKISNLCGD